MQELTSKYDILKVLGHGGFSAVFKARRKENPQDIVALKQLDFSVDDETSKEYRDFKDEVEILKKLDHPNIVKIYGDDVLDNKPALEMEYMEGETLEAILQKEGYFSIDDTLDVIAQIASALNYCHHYHIPNNMASVSDSVMLKRNAIIHNDINPKNIIRTTFADGSYRYVLIDFGLSFTDPDQVRHSKKEDGMAEYKAPEKWDGAQVDTPSDIYSFGIVIYELLTGSVPFPVTDYKQVREMVALELKHKSESVPDLCKKRMEAQGILSTDSDCDIPDWLRLLVKNCLEKNPQRRFKTGRELSRFFYDGLDGNIQVANEPVIDIDPQNSSIHQTATLEIIANVLTEAQTFTIEKEYTTVGRENNMPGSERVDIAIKTADRFMSKNHCQIIRREDEEGRYKYYLQDKVPSKNGTYYNADKNTIPLSTSVRILLKDGDYWWIGNTKIVFHLSE